MHRLLFCCVTVCAALAYLVPPASAASAAGADRDHDKVFDDLEHQLSGDRRLPVLVALRTPATAARLDTIGQAVGDLGDTTRLHIVPAFSARATPREIRALAARPDVASVQADAPVVPFGLSAQQSFGVTQARVQLPGLDGDADGDPTSYSTGDMVAAVVDSGMDPAMPDLKGKIVGWEDLVNHQDTPYDDLGHGSMVSDILAGSGASDPEGRGVAPGAALVGVKVVDGNAQSSLGLIAQGIQWVVDNRARYGIDAINLSIGDPLGCGDGTDVASQAVDAAVAAGIVVVAAAGNGGPANCTIKSPGAAQSALTVGALADTGAGGFSEPWFSSRGPTADGRMKPDVSAPGVAVVLAGKTGITNGGTGTSASTPFVTGTALLMREANPALTPAQVKDAIMRTAVDWGAPGVDTEYGAGRLDAYAALRAAGAALAVPPAVPSHREWAGSLTQGETDEEAVDVASAGFPLAVTLNGPAYTAGDLDLTVLDPSGKAVGATAVPIIGPPGRNEDLSVPAPEPGRYTVRVAAKTGAGPFTVDVSAALEPADLAPPALSFDTPAAATSDVTPTLTGAAGAALGDFPGVVVQVKRLGAVVRRIAAQPLLGRWSVTVSPPLPEGAYTATAEQGDAAGNAAHSPERAFTVDTQAPDAPVVAAPAQDGLQRSTTVTLGGTAEPGATVRASEGGQPRGDAAAGAGGAWTLDVPGAADGPHTYDLVAVDAAGNASPAAHRSVRVDSHPPAVTFSGGPEATTGSATATFAFSASEDGATFECRLDDSGAWAACASGVAFGSLGPGDHRLLVRATDPAGNTGPEAQWSWTIVAATRSRPCSLSLTAPGQRLAAVIRTGLVVKVAASRSCRVKLTLSLAGQSIRRSVSAGPKAVRVVLPLGTALRRRLAHRRTATFTLSVASPGARTVTRHFAVRR